MKFFNLDSPIMVFLGKVANLMVLNILTIVCCIPVVTSGAAITALYYVTIKMARGEDPYIVKNYFKSFKENFKQSTIIWLIMLVVAFIIYMDWRIIYQMPDSTFVKFMKIMIVIVTIFILLTVLYIFPVLARFENTIRNTIKNAFFISILNLPKSVLIVLIHLLPVAAVMLTVQAVPFVFLLGIPAVAYISSMLFVRVFKRFEPEEEEEGDPDAPLSFIVEEERAKQEAIRKQEESERLGTVREEETPAETEETVEEKTAEIQKEAAPDEEN